MDNEPVEFVKELISRPLNENEWKKMILKKVNELADFLNLRQASAIYDEFMFLLDKNGMFYGTVRVLHDNNGKKINDFRERPWIPASELLKGV